MYRIKEKTELKPNAEKLANSKKKTKKKTKQKTNDTKKTNHPKVRQSTWCISNVKNKRFFFVNFGHVIYRLIGKL
jgi:hypothetical protein